MYKYAERGMERLLIPQWFAARLLKKWIPKMLLGRNYRLGCRCLSESKLSPGHASFRQCENPSRFLTTCRSSADIYRHQMIRGRMSFLRIFPRQKLPHGLLSTAWILLYGVPQSLIKGQGILQSTYCTFISWISSQPGVDCPYQAVPTSCPCPSGYAPPSH